MMPYESPETYLSHRPPMLLVSEVLLIEEDAVRTCTKLGAEGPLARFAYAEGTVPNEFLLEIMAQSIGIWAGARKSAGVAAPEGETPAEVGFLLSVRQAKFLEAAVPATGTVITHMQKLLQEGQLATFEGAVTLEGRELARGRITVYQPLVREMPALFSRTNH